MAVIITKSASQALSTASAFYRVEAHNLGCLNATVLGVGTTRTIAFTPANAGNLQGVILALSPSATTLNRTLSVKLQENVATVWTDRVTETRTVAEVFGSQSLGQNAATFYTLNFASPYAVDTSAGKWRFEISQTGGSAGNFQLLTSDATNPFYATWCDNSVTFSSNDTVIARSGQYVTIDATATFKGVAVTGDSTYSVAAIACRNDAATSPDDTALFVWQNPASASYTLTIDGYFFISDMSGFRAGTSAAPITNANKADIYIQRAPTIGTAANSGFRMLGTRRGSFFLYGAAPTFADTHAGLAYGFLLDGTFTVTIASPAVVTRTTHGLTAGVPTPVRLTTTGALPTGLAIDTTYWTLRTGNSTLNLYDTYANALAGGTTGRINTSGTQSGTHTLWNVVTTSAPTGWAVGDTVILPKSSVTAGPADIGERTITWISGTEMTLSSALTSLAKSLSADSVVNLSKGYGIFFRSDAAMIQQNLQFANNLNVEGVRARDIGFTLGGSAGTSLVTSAFRQKMTVKNCSFYFNASAAICATACFNENGMDMQYINAITSRFTSTHFQGSSTALGVNGPLLIDNCYSYNQGNTMTTATAGSITITNNKFFSTAQYIILGTKGGTISGNYCYGLSSTVGFWSLSNAVGITFSNNTYELCYIPIFFSTTGLNLLFNNETFGTGALANTADVGFQTDALALNCELRSPNSTPVISTTNLSLTNNLTRFAITDSNNVSNADLNYLTYGYINRTGAGLADTTVRTAGGYGMRFEPTSSVNELYFEQDVPTGDISTKTMVVGAWIKINSANYWSGTHRMPRVTITYDGSSTVYGEAAQSTDWQFVFAAFTPTTTAGQITVKVGGYTDQTTTNAYFYLDDMSVLYPAGSTINLGSLDLWSGGLPITPTISTLATAGDVWAIPTSTLTGAGTIGKFLKKKIGSIFNFTA